MVFSHHLLDYKETIWKSNLFAEWYKNGFTHLLFSNWAHIILSLPDMVGGLPRESYGEGHFCFNFCNIWDLAKSFSHTSSTQPPHEVTKVLLLEHLWFFRVCCFLKVLFTHDHWANWASENLSTVRNRGKQRHSALSKPVTGSLTLSREHYPKWWLKDPLKHLKTRMNTYLLWEEDELEFYQPHSEVHFIIKRLTDQLS